MAFIFEDNIVFQTMRHRWIETKYFSFDIWSLIHFGVGMLLGVFFDITDWWRVLALLSLIVLSLVGGVLGDCTFTLDKSEYSNLETVTATATCTDADKSYDISWYNDTGTLFETDVGITPSVSETPFFETFKIPSDWQEGVF